MGEDVQTELHQLVETAQIHLCQIGLREKDVDELTRIQRVVELLSVAVGVAFEDGLE